MPNTEKHDLFKFVKWDQVKNFYGVAVAADAEPNDKYDHKIFPGISLETMKLWFKDRHLQCPRKLWSACQSRNWLADLKQAKESIVSIKFRMLLTDFLHLRCRVQKTIHRKELMVLR